MTPSAVGEADDHLEVGADAGAVGGLLDQLQVAVGVGDGAGFFVEICGGQDDVGEHSGLGEEHVLDDDEGVFERRRIDAVAGDRIGADDVEGGELAASGGIEHLDEIEAGLGGQGAAIFLGEGSWALDRQVAGKQSGSRPMSAAPRELA